MAGLPFTTEAEAFTNEATALGPAEKWESYWRAAQKYFLFSGVLLVTNFSP